jgi:hypothetical protein
VVLYGEIDTENRFPAVVTVSPFRTPGKRIVEECSGVVISPRLILTAGHCLCQLRQGAAPEGALRCEPYAVVTTFIQEPSKTVPGEVELRTHVHKGRVRPHPDLHRQSHSPRQPGLADLAVVLLEGAVRGGVAAIPLADSEVRDGETVAMVGYGYDELIGGRYGNRRFSRNKIAKDSASSVGEILFELPGMRIYSGDEGGPCLRETQEGLQLVGILTQGSNEGSTFTSTYPYRSWLSAELRNAAAKGPPLE